MRWLWCACIGLLLHAAAFAQYIPTGSPSFSTSFPEGQGGCDYLFVGGFRFILPSPRRATEMILDHHGDIVWYHQGGNYTLDFKVHPNGLLSYSDRYKLRMLDSTFTIVDSVNCVGRITDQHELQITPDGHYYIICRDDSTLDLRALHTLNGTQGDSAAQVRMVTIQELDPAKQLVREWNGWDHFSIFDSDTTYFTNPGLLDLSHTNSIDIGTDGQVLLSHRHLNELTLVDWPSGQVTWQLSGKNNDFDLLGDPGYYGQHDARLLPDGRISLFDNGHFQHHARGLVLEIDTLLWQARIVAQYADTLHSNSMGGFQLLPDGSALVNLGELTATNGAELRLFGPDSTLRMRLDFAPGYMTYRAHCLDLPFQLHRPQILCSMQAGDVVLSVDGSHAAYEWTTGDNSASIVVNDTGRYQVFVPQGIGMIASPAVHITDLQDACLQVGAPAAAMPPVRSPRLLGRWDLLGRPVLAPAYIQVVVERYDDGSTRKVVVQPQ